MNQSGVEWADLESRYTDSEVGCYLSDRDVRGESKDAVGTAECNAFKTSG